MPSSPDSFTTWVWPGPSWRWTMASRVGPPPHVDQIWSELDLLHEDLSSIMAELWELPNELRLHVSHHHQVLVHGVPDATAAVVCLAEDLANQLGWSVQAQPSTGAVVLTVDCSMGGVVDRSREVLGLNDNAYDKLFQECKETLEQLAASA